MTAHSGEIIQLLIAYALAGVVVFTAIITSLSLVGVVKFRTPKQQKVLFAVLVVEVVSTAVAFFADFIKYNPTDTIQKVAFANSLPDIRRAIDAAKQDLAAARHASEDGRRDLLADAHAKIRGVLRNDQLGDLLPFRDLFSCAWRDITGTGELAGRRKLVRSSTRGRSW